MVNGTKKSDKTVALTGKTKTRHHPDVLVFLSTPDPCQGFFFSGERRNLMKPLPMSQTREGRRILADPEAHELDFIIRSIRNHFFHCHRCRHWDGNDVHPTCKAFPHGVPNDIWNGQKRHVKKMFSQDNDIVFKHKPFASKEGV